MIKTHGEKFQRKNESDMKKNVISKEKGKLNKIPVTWSGYQSHNQDSNVICPRASIGVFPEFYDKAVTMSMQKRGMKMMLKATEHVNPGQIPVLVADSPYILS